MLSSSILARLKGKIIHVELKSGLKVSGTFADFDQFLNMLIENPVVKGNDPLFTHIAGGEHVFIRGSSLRLVYLDANDDPELSLRKLADRSRLRWASMHQSTATEIK